MQPTLPSTVAYVGNFAPSWSTENHVKLSLEELGVVVVPFQESELHAGTDGGWPTLADRAVAAGADALLWTRTWQHDRPEEQDAALVAVRAAGIPSASYHLDLYVGLDREEQIGREAFWRTDVVCTADGALSDEEWASRFGVNHRWVRPGVLRAECVPGTPNRQYQSDVAFVGSFGHYHAEWPYRQQLITWLQRTYGRRFARWPRNAGHRIHSQALNDLYASAKVVVGDSLCLGFDRPRYWSDRVYETIGRGGFLIHPRIEGLAGELVDGEHLRFYTYGDWDELRGLIDYYLRHDDERQAIAAAGQAHVRENCTYTQRVGDMLGHLGAVDLAAPRPVRVEPPQPPPVSSRRLETGQVVNFRDGTTDEVCFREVWDQAEYHGAVPFLPGAVVLDVGANVGAFSLWALAQGARLVHAYEPEPGNRAMLEAHVAGKAVEVRPVAVGAEAGELFLAPGPGGLHGGGTHVASIGDLERLADEAEAHQPVPVISVNDVLRDAIAAGGGTVGVWKIDCEGAEYDIIGAAEPELLQAVRCIVMEYHGPGMPHLPHLQGAAQVGPLLAKLAEYGRLETMGRPSVGGTLTWRRYA